MMKPLSEQDHYEVLEIPRDCSRDGIERAYQIAQATYAEESLAGYSILGEGDARAIRERIDTAYRVLSDMEARRVYDESLVVRDAPELPLAEPQTPAPVTAEATGPAEPVMPIEAFEDFDDDSGDYDGARLRRSRLRRGMELAEIARVTKVNPTYLHFLEEERFEDLPARVYVRGFVSAYASSVGLDPRTVTDAYMRRFDQESDQPKRRGVRRR